MDWIRENRKNRKMNDLDLFFSNLRENNGLIDFLGKNVLDMTLSNWVLAFLEPYRLEYGKIIGGQSE